MADISSLQRLAPSIGGLLGRSRSLIWGASALALIVAPLIFSSSASISFMSQLGTLTIFCLSYNMLFGEGGMLSFGHAIYSGLGAYFAIHAMNLSANGALDIPVWLIPLIGGLAGSAFGIVFGYLTTKKSGMTFAMITLGMGELVHAFSQMFPGFFGGEGGIATNRTYGEPVFGITFGPQLQVYYLIVAWLIICAAAMYAFTQTPLGRIVNAVRDNAERAEFIGYDPRMVRFLVLVVSSFFAGISGGLTAINLEIITSESLSALRSSDGLLFTFIGGAESFFGPIVGVVVGGFLAFRLSDYTMAWQLYLGMFFILFVMYAPGGIAGIIVANWRVLRAGMFGQILPSWLAVIASAAAMVAAVAAIVELAYYFVFGSHAVYAAFTDKRSYAVLWAAVIVLLVVGVLSFRRTLARFSREWGAVNADINGSAPRD
jgi:branched-chain amino acid transport system permease protein